MTNDNLKQEMGLVYQSLTDLLAFTGSESIDRSQLKAFITLIRDRYEQLESDLCDQLDCYVLRTHLKEHGDVLDFKNSEKLFKVHRAA